MKSLLNEKELNFRLSNLRTYGDTLVKNFFQAQQVIKASELDCYEKPSPMGYLVVVKDRRS